jgi:hypothetical protein
MFVGNIRAADKEIQNAKNLRLRDKESQRIIMIEKIVIAGCIVKWSTLLKDI